MASALSITPSPREPAVGHDSEVALLELAARQGCSQKLEDGAGPSGDEQTRGLGVEPMDEPWLARAVADARHFREMPDESVRERSELIRGEGHARLTSDFVDDDELGQLESHVEPRFGLGQRLVVFELGAKFIARSRRVAGARSPASRTWRLRSRRAPWRAVARARARSRATPDRAASRLGAPRR